MFYNPEKMILAISQTRDAIKNRLEEINAEARVHLNQFGVPSDITEMLDIEKEQRKLLGKTAKLDTRIRVDFDLTKGGG